MHWPGRFSGAVVRAERERIARARNLRSGPSIFYLGPNNSLARTLANHSDELPLAVCYFWSAETLNLAPFHNFTLGLIVDEQWEALLGTANSKVINMLATTPIYLLTSNAHFQPRAGAFPIDIRGALPTTANWGAIAAEIMTTLSQMELRNSEGKVIHLERSPHSA